MAMGRIHSMYVDEGGILWTTGANNCGQLGHGHFENLNRFTKVDTLPKDKPVIHIAAGEHKSMVQLEDNSLWVAGNNLEGKLGLNSKTRHFPAFQPITSLPKDKQIVDFDCGETHSLVLLSDGTVWGAGSNYTGQLGLVDKSDIVEYKALPIPTSSPVVHIKIGINYSFLILADGSVWATGKNDKNQLGLNDITTRYEFTQLTALPKQVRCISIATKMNFSYFLLADGCVMVSGKNDVGQLGIDVEEYKLSPETDSYMLSKMDIEQPPILSIQTNARETFLLLKDQSIWVTPSYNIDALHNYKKSKELFIGLPFPMVNPKFFDLSVNLGSYLVLLEDETLWANGSNHFGELGLGDNVRKKTFSRVLLSTCDLQPKSKKRATLKSFAHQQTHVNPMLAPYGPDAFNRNASQIGGEFAAHLFMPHLYGCAICKRYVKPTVWGECPYPHAAGVSKP